MIRIGTQIPNETIQTTTIGTQKSVKYIDTGIVLNVRPGFPKMVQRLPCRRKQS